MYNFGFVGVNADDKRLSQYYKSHNHVGTDIIRP